MRAAFAALALSLALAACGGGGSSGGEAVSVAQQRVACLDRAGAHAELIEGSGYEMVGAHTPDGNVIFILDLPEPELAEAAIAAVKGRLKKGGIGGILTSRTIAGGSTLVMVLGHAGSEGGAPSATTERVARECAIRPRAGTGDLL